MPQKARGSRVTRRQVLKAMATTGVGLATGAAGYGYLVERHQIQVTRAALPVSGLPDALVGLQIGFLTDLHLSPGVPASDITEAVSLLLEERPDLIALGGDYVSWGDREFVGPCAELLAPLTAPHGVFAILGNHDDERDMPAALDARGFTVLTDTRTRITIRGEALEIAGLKFWTRKVPEIAATLRGATGPLLLLAHDPRRLVEASDLDVSVVLSGHTHGGQIVLPLLGAVAAQGRNFPALAGPVRRLNTTLFVSRGVGTVLLPLRLNCPPEVAILTLDRLSQF